MRTRALARFAGGLFALTVVLVILMTVLSAGREEAFDTLLYGLLSLVLLYGLLSLVLGAAGAVVATNHPNNAVGWLFRALALHGALTESAEGWGYVAVERRLPGGPSRHR